MGCTGSPMDSHDIRWYTIHKDKLLRCGECGSGESCARVFGTTTFNFLHLQFTSWTTTVQRRAKHTITITEGVTYKCRNAISLFLISSSPPLPLSPSREVFSPTQCDCSFNVYRIIQHERRESCPSLGVPELSRTPSPFEFLLTPPSVHLIAPSLAL